MTLEILLFHIELDWIANLLSTKMCINRKIAIAVYFMEDSPNSQVPLLQWKGEQDISFPTNQHIL